MLKDIVDAVVAAIAAKGHVTHKVDTGLDDSISFNNDDQWISEEVNPTTITSNTKTTLSIAFNVCVLGKITDFKLDVISFKFSSLYVLSTFCI